MTGLLDTIDDEVIEVDPPKAKASSSKVASKVTKTSANEKEIEAVDDEDEGVVIRKAKGPARKTAAASKKALEKAKPEPVSPPSGAFIHPFICSLSMG